MNKKIYGTAYKTEELAFIREHEDGTKEKRRWIAEQLGRTFYSVDHKVCALGWGRNKCVRFSGKELDWIKENGRRYSIPEMSEKIKEIFGVDRTYTSLNVQCKKMKIDRRKKEGWYSSGDVAKIFGCSRTHIRDLIARKELKATRRPSIKEECDWSFTEQSIYDYLVEHSNTLVDKKVDLVKIAQILTKNSVVVEKIVYRDKRFTNQHNFKMNITKPEWDLFVWQRDECSRVQSKNCEGCGFQSQCASFYDKIGEYYKYFETRIFDTEGIKGDYNPCVEGHDTDLMETLNKKSSNKFTMLDVKSVAPMGCGKGK